VGSRVATPARVARELSFASITAGSQTTCGITRNGAAYCWGKGTFGGLGNGTTATSALPVRLPDPS
jgi:alpha-tubulin suppressor-like RCC1 family protein